MARKNKRRIFLGNVAIARGLLESGCHVVTSYPGTPSSEIVPAVVEFRKELGLNTYIEWSSNEKVAFDVALAASMTGKRAAVAMKQVGLNVASDSLLSSAYTGVVGGLVIISCDDPGPHSSQTEQDSRFYGMFAKIPVFDPSSPEEARDMVKDAFQVSEEFQIPVLLRPTIRISHGKQSMNLRSPQTLEKRAHFEKDPQRWAATPRYRLALHARLNQKLKEIEEKFEHNERWNIEEGTGESTSLGVIACSASFAVLMDLLEDLHLKKVMNILKIGTPYPLPQKKVRDFIQRHKKVLVLEEPDAAIETQILDKRRVIGRLTGHVPSQGELTPEVINSIMAKVSREFKLARMSPISDPKLERLIQNLELPTRRPTLCAGCPERAAFFAIRKAFPKGIYPSDIGCYTLGLNLKAVDTVLDMGAGITFGSGFYQAYHQDHNDIPIIATMGDSTFYHSGTASLVNAVYNNARFILVILDNETTAMTGMQPTPGSGLTADKSEGRKVSLTDLIKGCGVRWIRIVDPYKVKEMIKLLKQAREYTLRKEGGMAVIIARHRCLIRYPEEWEENREVVKINEDCNGCMYCIDFFECPALRPDETKTGVEIDRMLCVDCGVCVSVCPRGAIVPLNGEEKNDPIKMNKA